MAAKFKKDEKQKTEEIGLAALYSAIIQEMLAQETEEEKREKQILLDKLRVYMKGKELVLENSRC